MFCLERQDILNPIQSIAQQHRHHAEHQQRQGVLLPVLLLLGSMRATL